MLGSSPFATWRGLPLVFTSHGLLRTDDLGLDVRRVAELLDESNDCKQRKRARGILERCARWAGRGIRISLKRDYSPWVDGPAWVIINVKPYIGGRGYE